MVPGADLTGGVQLQNSEYSAIEGGSNGGLGVHNGWLDDLDGDGRPELVVSEWAGTGLETESGVVYVIPGAQVFDGGDVADLAMTTIQGNVAYGRLVPSGEHWGDYDGDGLQDLVVSHVGGSAFASITPVAHAMSGSDLMGGGVEIDLSDAMATFPFSDGG